MQFNFFLFQNADLVNTQNWLNLFAEVILVSVFAGCSIWSCSQVTAGKNEGKEKWS